MVEKTVENNRIVRKLRQWVVSPRGMLALAGALVVILGLVIGLNVGGLREELLWRISPPRIDSLAVLPLENLSHDPEQEYCAEGMTMRLIIQLQRIGSFRVIAVPSVLRYRKAPKPLPEIARELNVAAIIQGGVLRSSDRVRISLNIIHAPTNRRLWGQTYERELRNIPELEAEISRAVAVEIKAPLNPRQEALLTGSRPVNPQAFDALLRGMATMMGDPTKAEAYLKQAIQLDPELPDSYGFLSGSKYMPNMFPTLAPRDTYPAANGGRVEARSDGPGCGSEFRVWLPLLPSLGRRPENQAVERTKIKQPLRILVVDDNADSAELLSVLLEIDGHRVIVANSGPTAIDKALEHPPEVALIDIGMPGMDGYEVVKRMRASPELKHVAFVAISGYGQQEDIQKSREAGFDDHLVKPVDLLRLGKVLQTIAKRSL